MPARPVADRSRALAPVLARGPALALVVGLVACLGVAGCGTDDPQPKAAPTASTVPQPSSAPTGTPEPSGGTSPTSPALGLPTDFPEQSDVPVVPGVVTSKVGGKDENGKIGYVIEMSAAGSRQDCFDRAAAALVAAGFTKRGELEAQGTKQAQFTTSKWAVIISSRADGENCQLGYEVGQLTP